MRFQQNNKINLSFNISEVWSSFQISKTKKQ